VRTSIDLWLWPYATAKDQSKHKQYQEDIEDDPGGTGGGTGDAPKSEKPCDKRNY
jgi:hypothetical protein